MANSELYDKNFSIDDSIVKYIQQALVKYPDGDGVKRAKFIVNNKSITYQGMKRIKNFFDNYNPNKDSRQQYELAGGEKMKGYIEKTLNAERDAVSRSKDLKRDMTNDPKQDLHPYKASASLNEGDIAIIDNAVAIIFNNEGKILLLKRSSDLNQWMPNKWALVGGGVEKTETPKEACIREIKEETNIEPKFFSKKYSLNKNPDSIEHVFICKFEGDPMDVEINNESSAFGWFSVNEMDYMDTVPFLNEFINIAKEVINSEIN